MTSRAFLLIRLGIYLVMTACIEASKEFLNVGAAALRTYTHLDWMILIVGILAVALPNVLSFFDTTAGDYRKNGNGSKPTGNTETIVKATLPLLLLLTLLIPGCTVVSANRAFPKLDWYWSADAKEQRKEARP